MDLEGIGAVAAASVAGIGIPAAVLVGRWQMKAALRTADATTRAGQPQAQAAYRAALDAVRAQANATHVQQRRAHRREAYASFLLAAQHVRELGERFVEANAEPLPEARLRAGKAGIAPAAGMTTALLTISSCMVKQATYERAQAQLGGLLDDPSSDVGAAAWRLYEGLAAPHSVRPSQLAEWDEPTDALMAAQSACRTARRELPSDALGEAEFETLLQARSFRPSALSERYFDAVTGFDDAEVRFVRAAEAELHPQPVL
ncbi:hypothetical protein [Streptomyces xanthochromogenes]|uniref:hypothetical protein n=1 Tax=Streptomyces xanthochromogenes TaxID=67384 RepID=UPI0016774B76|nr:hypothetical protein [Streptomyces xanthochromogenes]